MADLFGTDGIRGRANQYPVTPEVALRLGKAIGQVFGVSEQGAKPPRVLIGKDTRLSGYMLETALTSGLVSAGLDVFLVGPLPTPAVAHLARSMNAAVGIMLTASHNPFDDNGIKLFGPTGFKLSDEMEGEIEDWILRGPGDNGHVSSERLGKAFRIEDARGRYIEYAKNTVGNQELDDLKIVLDCANGAAYQIGPWIFKELGATVIKLHTDPDGYNINNGCGALHPETISRAVVEHEADLGIAFDGDADRVIFCDSNGEVVDGDRVLGMCALDCKKHNRLAHDTFVITSMSNLGLRKAMEEHGIDTVVTDVGDRHVIEQMRAGGYNLGGEKSGHLIFMDFATTGDGIISALQVLRLMKETGAPMSELAQCMTEYPQVLKSLNVKRKVPLEELQHLSQAVQECEEALRDKGRVVVRYSGTEPKIRFLVEAEDEALVERWIDALCATAEKELG